MGLVTVTMLVKGKRGRSRNVEFLVDSGAVWSVLPKKDWEALGLKPERRHRFSLADTTVIERNVSECRFRYEGNEASSPVVLGEEGDVALLGCVTLETLALVLNPFDRSLRPMRMLLCPVVPVPHASGDARAASI
jgi:predicted aspartyl protease